MGYIKEFEAKIRQNDYSGILTLWEEYCSTDEVDAQDLTKILKALKVSPFVDSFGRHAERILPLWHIIEDPFYKNEVLKYIVDIQTVNDPELGQLVYDHLTSLYGSDKYFQEKIKLVGLRERQNYRGCISHFELLNHLERGNFVFHSGGWGVGEIIDVSLLREQVSIEFENVSGKKDIPFENAFKTLIPLPKEHFLAQRFGDPDALEKKARENPLEVMHLLLKDLGPQTAAEIKDALCELVIPEGDWAKWWQATRSKMKKDTMIETPSSLKEPFILREQGISHEETLLSTLDKPLSTPALISTVYSFLRDFSEICKKKEIRTFLINKLKDVLTHAQLNEAEEIQIHFFLEDLKAYDELSPLHSILNSVSSLVHTVRAVEILAYKKRLLSEIKKCKGDWEDIFLKVLFDNTPNTIRDYILQELLDNQKTEKLMAFLKHLVAHPANQPELFLWYFQKAMSKMNTPFSSTKERSLLFEALLVLLSQIDTKDEYRDLVKKILALLYDDRYALVRKIMKDASLEEVKEFLLLSSKCFSLTDHDRKIFRSLAEVVYPKIGSTTTTESAASSSTIWTTEEGYQKTHKRMQDIATIETIETAKEIETARAHGDLRENAEFKAALEKRDRLQAELKLLSDQLQNARIITENDIDPSRVGVGTVVVCKNDKGQTFTYTLLGPWDADSERGILSFQSKFAQTMKDLQVGDTFHYQNEEFTIISIKSYLN